MGEQKVKRFKDSSDKLKSIDGLLGDIEALDYMLDQGIFEKSPIRVEAEQNFCLVDNAWEPSTKSMEVKKALNDPYFTTELALYNLEANLAPLILTGDYLSKMHRQLDDLLAKARLEAAKKDL